VSYNVNCGVTITTSDVCVQYGRDSRCLEDTTLSELTIDCTELMMHVGVVVFRQYSQELLELLLNMDKLLATDEHFLLGIWLENAKNLSISDDEQRLYEYNARNQITLWGPDGNVCICP